MAVAKSSDNYNRIPNDRLHQCFRENEMSFLGIVAFAGVLLFLIMLMSKSMRRQPIKAAAIGFAICLVVFVVCMAFAAKNNKQGEKALKETQTQSEAIGNV